MAWSRSLDLLRHWQANLEISSETGQSAVLDMGAYGSPLDNVAMLVSFHAFASERCDLVAPLAVCGGYSLTWLIALMHFRECRDVVLSPEMRVIYGGADLATHVASLSTYYAQGATTAPDAPGVLSTALAVFFDPAAQAGPALWAAMPFAETTATAALAPAHPEMSSEGQRWLTWIAVLVSVGLVLSAMIV